MTNNTIKNKRNKRNKRNERNESLKQNKKLKTKKPKNLNTNNHTNEMIPEEKMAGGGTKEIDYKNTYIELLKQLDFYNRKYEKKVI